MTEREIDSFSSVDLTVLCSVGLTSQAHSDGRTAVRLSCPDRWNESLAIVPANDGDFQQHAENRWLTYWPAVTILGSLPWTSLPTSHTLATEVQQSSARTALWPSRPQRLTCSRRRSYIPATVLLYTDSVKHNALLLIYLNGFACMTGKEG